MPTAPPSYDEPTGLQMTDTLVFSSQPIAPLLQRALLTLAALLLPLQIASAAMTGKASATKMDAPKFCFGEGTQVHTARGLEEIQDLEPGRRVLADSGTDMAASQVRGEGWLRVEFGFADPFGSGRDCRVVLLRPAAEVARNGWAAGVQVPADFGEEIHTGEQASARVLSVSAAGPVEQGAGHVVTGTFQTWNADVRELWMEGLEAPVRVTGGHRFYSESRGWVEAHRLLVGETVRTRDGSGARVLGQERLPGVHAVFNLEIEGLHQYHVSPLGLLAHNNNKCESTNTSAQNTQKANEAAEAGGDAAKVQGGAES